VVEAAVSLALPKDRDRAAPPPSASAQVAARPAFVHPAEPDPTAAAAPAEAAPRQQAALPPPEVESVESAPDAVGETARTPAAAAQPEAPVPAAPRARDAAPEEFIAPAEDELEAARPTAPRPGLDVASLLVRLRAQGFGSFTAVTQQGEAYVFRAVKDGRAVQVTVDAGTGTVLAVQ
jgi:hypothetical protein